VSKKKKKKAAKKSSTSGKGAKKSSSSGRSKSAKGSKSGRVAALGETPSQLAKKAKASKSEAELTAEAEDRAIKEEAAGAIRAAAERVAKADAEKAAAEKAAADKSEAGTPVLETATEPEAAAAAEQADPELDAALKDAAAAYDAAEESKARSEAAEKLEQERRELLSAARDAQHGHERGTFDRLLEVFGAASTGGGIVGLVEHRQRVFTTVTRDALAEVARFLRDEEDLSYDFFIEATCADYLKLPELAPGRFGLLYVLYSIARDDYVRLRVYLDPHDLFAPTISSVFPGAIWAEREIFDLYGVEFTGHPDQRRILLPDYYTGHPLRKDYPLKGRGERDSFPVITRRES
jgi:NADH-quinone oxidoreductase subunit C